VRAGHSKCLSLLCLIAAHVWSTLAACASNSLEDVRRLKTLEQDGDLTGATLLAERLISDLSRKDPKNRLLPELPSVLGPVNTRIRK
jgi:hypothetical protein